MPRCWLLLLLLLLLSNGHMHLKPVNLETVTSEETACQLIATGTCAHQA
jgi:hypothetical protein